MHLHQGHAVDVEERERLTADLVTEDREYRSSASHQPDPRSFVVQRSNERPETALLLSSSLRIIPTRFERDQNTSLTARRCVFRF